MDEPTTPEDADRDLPDFDLDDAALRRMQLLKWSVPAPDVLPAWVAEMDVLPPRVAREAMVQAVHRGTLGYPPPALETPLAEALAGFSKRRLAWDVDPGLVLAVGDVMSGVRVALHALAEPGPVVVPVPVYAPFFAAVAATGHELVAVPCLDDGPGTPDRLDLEAVGAALAAGARTVLLSNPGNPQARTWPREQLEGLRDLVVRHGARVVSDEVHAPLTAPGAVHVPFSSLDGAAGLTTTVVAASKAFNLAGAKCAQVVAGTPDQVPALRAACAQYSSHSFSTLGTVASTAVYTDADPWLDALLAHLDARRAQLRGALAAHLPAVRWAGSDSTYLAWLDASGVGHDAPDDTALERGKVMLGRGAQYGGVPHPRRYARWVRLNLATSAERLDRIVAGLVHAWT